jgi:hypothetical protein
LLENLQRSLSVGDGLSPIAQLVQRQAHVEKRIAFAAPVAVLRIAREDQRLFVELDGAVGVAQVGIGQAQLAQGLSFTGRAGSVEQATDTLFEKYREEPFLPTPNDPALHPKA